MCQSNKDTPHVSKAKYVGIIVIVNPQRLQGQSHITKPTNIEMLIKLLYCILISLIKGFPSDGLVDMYKDWHESLLFIFYGQKFDLKSPLGWFKRAKNLCHKVQKFWSDSDYMGEINIKRHSIFFQCLTLPQFFSTYVPYYISLGVFRSLTKKSMFKWCKALSNKHFWVKNDGGIFF